MDTNRTALYAGTFCYAFVLLFFLSSDSYLYDVFQRCDSAWFFMCGKAWMNGMVPYVDFADSKGPLLWLIYGCGYLLCHHSYVGVFWLSCLSYTATLILSYRLARLFVSKETALSVMAVLPIALLLKGIHNEVRAEDFCYPFIMLCLFSVIRLTKEQDKPLFQPAFAIGSGIMCCLLIKWSVAAMLCGTAAVVLAVSIRRRRLDGILGGVLGLSGCALPFLIYFLLQGNLEAFIQEYFLNTYTTVSHEPLHAVVFERALHLGGSIFYKKFAIIVMGFLFFCHRYKLSWWLCSIPFPFVLLLATPGYGYYYTVMMPLFVVAAIVCADYATKHFHMQRKWLYCGYAAIALCGLAYDFRRATPFPLKHKETAQSRAFHNMEKLMSIKEHPLVMCYRMDNGIGVVADALPACKYWALQNGATPAMYAERAKALKARKADFIIVAKQQHNDDDALRNGTLEENGYVFCGVSVGVNGDIDQFIYVREELKACLPVSSL